MARPSHRDKILAEGLRVVHERGFGAASVRDIVRAAGVPQGSFTNHFASKAAFGLEVLELYYAESEALFDETLRNPALAPLDRIARYIEATIARQCADGMQNGCLVGNFSAEGADQSDAIRARLTQMAVEIQGMLAACLSDAIAAGDLPPDSDVEALAVLIHAGQQGATLIAKTQRSSRPLEQFKAALFGAVLRKR